MMIKVQRVKSAAGVKVQSKHLENPPLSPPPPRKIIFFKKKKYAANHTQELPSSMHSCYFRH